MSKYTPLLSRHRWAGQVQSSASLPLSSISTTQQSRPVRVGDRGGDRHLVIFYPKEGWKNRPPSAAKTRLAKRDERGTAITGESLRSACAVGVTFCGCRSEDAAVRPGPRMTAAKANRTAASPVVSQRFHVSEPVSDRHLLVLV